MMSLKTLKLIHHHTGGLENCGEYGDQTRRIHHHTGGLEK